MTTRLSTKGQIVLPKEARTRLQLRPGVRLICRVEGESIVLTREQPRESQVERFRDRTTGLVVTRSPKHVHVTSADVRASLVEFP